MSENVNFVFETNLNNVTQSFDNFIKKIDELIKKFDIVKDNVEKGFRDISESVKKSSDASKGSYEKFLNFVSTGTQTKIRKEIETAEKLKQVYKEGSNERIQIEEALTSKLQQIVDNERQKELQKIKQMQQKVISEKEKAVKQKEKFEKDYTVAVGAELEKQKAKVVYKYNELIRLAKGNKEKEEALERAKTREIENIEKKSAQKRKNIFQQMNQNILNQTKMFLSAVIGMYAINFVKESTKLFTEFEEGIASTISLDPRTLQSWKGAFSEGVLDVMKNTGDSVGSLTKGLYDLISAGTEASQAIERLELASKLGIVGLSNTATGVDVLTNVLNVYNKELTNQDAADIFIKTVQKGKTTVNDYASVLGSILPIGKAANQSFRELSAAMVELTLQGGTTAERATQLRGLLTALATVKVQKNFEKIGISLTQIGKDGVKEIKPLSQIFDELNKSGQQLSLIDLAKMIPNIRARQAFLALQGSIDGTSKLMKRFQEDFKDTTGALNESFQAIEETTAHRMKVIKGEIQATMISIGESFAPIGILLFDAFRDILPTIQNILKGIAPVLATLIQSVKPILDSVMLIINNVFNALSPVITNLVNTLSPVLLKIGELIGKLAEPATKIITTLSSVANGLLQILQPVIDGFLWLTDVLSNVGIFISNILSGITGGIFEFIFGKPDINVEETFRNIGTQLKDIEKTRENLDKFENIDTKFKLAKDTEEQFNVIRKSMEDIKAMSPVIAEQIQMILDNPNKQTIDGLKQVDNLLQMIYQQQKAEFQLQFEDTLQNIDKVFAEVSDGFKLNVDKTKKTIDLIDKLEIGGKVGEIQKEGFFKDQAELSQEQLKTIVDTGLSMLNTLSKEEKNTILELSREYNKFSSQITQTENSILQLAIKSKQPINEVIQGISTLNIGFEQQQTIINNVRDRMQNIIENERQMEQIETIRNNIINQINDGKSKELLVRQENLKLSEQERLNEINRLENTVKNLENTQKMYTMFQQNLSQDVTIAPVDIGGLEDARAKLDELKNQQIEYNTLNEKLLDISGEKVNYTEEELQLLVDMNTLTKEQKDIWEQVLKEKENLIKDEEKLQDERIQLQLDKELEAAGESAELQLEAYKRASDKRLEIEIANLRTEMLTRLAMFEDTEQMKTDELERNAIIRAQIEANFNKKVTMMRESAEIKLEKERMKLSKKDNKRVEKEQDKRHKDTVRYQKKQEKENLKIEKKRQKDYEKSVKETEKKNTKLLDDRYKYEKELRDRLLKERIDEIQEKVKTGEIDVDTATSDINKLFSNLKQQAKQTKGYDDDFETRRKVNEEIKDLEFKRLDEIKKAQENALEYQKKFNEQVIQANNKVLQDTKPTKANLNALRKEYQEIIKVLEKAENQNFSERKSEIEKNIQKKINNLESGKELELMREKNSAIQYTNKKLQHNTKIIDENNKKIEELKNKNKELSKTYQVSSQELSKYKSRLGINYEDIKGRVANISEKQEITTFQRMAENAERKRQAYLLALEKGNYQEQLVALQDYQEAVAQVEKAFYGITLKETKDAVRDTREAIVEMADNYKTNTYDIKKNDEEIQKLEKDNKDRQKYIDDLNIKDKETFLEEVENVNEEEKKLEQKYQDDIAEIKKEGNKELSDLSKDNSQTEEAKKALEKNLRSQFETMLKLINDDFKIRKMDLLNKQEDEKEILNSTYDDRIENEKQKLNELNKNDENYTEKKKQIEDEILRLSNEKNTNELILQKKHTQEMNDLYLDVFNKYRDQFDVQLEELKKRQEEEKIILQSANDERLKDLKDRLEKERQLIEEEYNKRIEEAKQRGEDTTNLEKEKQDKLNEQQKKGNEEIAKTQKEGNDIQTKQKDAQFKEELNLYLNQTKEIMTLIQDFWGDFNNVMEGLQDVFKGGDKTFGGISKIIGGVAGGVGSALGIPMVGEIAQMGVGLIDGIFGISASIEAEQKANEQRDQLRQEIDNKRNSLIEDTNNLISSQTEVIKLSNDLQLEGYDEANEQLVKVTETRQQLEANVGLGIGGMNNEELIEFYDSFKKQQLDWQTNFTEGLNVYERMRSAEIKRDEAEDKGWWWNFWNADERKKIDKDLKNKQEDARNWVRDMKFQFQGLGFSAEQITQIFGTSNEVTSEMLDRIKGALDNYDTNIKEIIALRSEEIGLNKEMLNEELKQIELQEKLGEIDTTSADRMKYDLITNYINKLRESGLTEKQIRMNYADFLVQQKELNDKLNISIDETTLSGKEILDQKLEEINLSEKLGEISTFDADKERLLLISEFLDNLREQGITEEELRSQYADLLVDEYNLQEKITRDILNQKLEEIDLSEKLGDITTADADKERLLLISEFLNNLREQGITEEELRSQYADLLVEEYDLQKKITDELEKQNDQMSEQIKNITSIVTDLRTRGQLELQATGKVSTDVISGLEQQKTDIIQQLTLEGATPEQIQSSVSSIDAILKSFRGFETGGKVTDNISFAHKGELVLNKDVSKDLEDSIGTENAINLAKGNISFSDIIPKLITPNVRIPDISREGINGIDSMDNINNTSNNNIVINLGGISFNGTKDINGMGRDLIKKIDTELQKLGRSIIQGK